MIKRTVARLIKQHRTNNPFEIASQKNIVVLFEQLGQTFGYFHTFNRIRTIHINCDLDKHWQRFVCAHELGHSILHKNVNTPFLRKNTLFSVDRIEREANGFAVCLLTYEEKISYGETIESFYSRSGVPNEMIEKGVFDRALIACEQKASYMD
ncbi:ImmA/IrrE family metallo-endopeptidase [Fodinisporobacter ferrooxydans]|uniref:ImmA/IrrE family metallo-endopeptidase n=1 Tax=Fodinisporobacter ferrooxydans TaxID=2901836 RepID=A0ABY4CKI4_9BACL|nr:ImmA/IrrE family metallo-endopeptidase [Alicyclobacillaceae bacterium MYW30-H2]